MSKTPNRSEERSLKTTSSSCLTKKFIYKTVAVLLALTVWQLASVLLGSEILLVSPVAVVKRLFTLVGEKEFFSTLIFTFVRIVVGFFGGLTIGIVLAVLAGRYKIIEYLLWPYMITVKSVPIASFVIIALLWFSSSWLASFVAFLIVLPIVYTNLLSGIRSTDKKLIEMANVFKMSRINRFRFVYIPSITPFLVSSCKLSAGLAWKAGVAAELIGTPDGSVGESLYFSKLFLNTADLFAWTLAIIIVSVVFEKIFMFALKKITERIVKV